MTTHNHTRRDYPAPTIVVGVGRLGLSVLERLGEDWEGVQRATDDPSLKNLRLLHVHADEEVPSAEWRKNERQFVQIARYTTDGDLPTLALDFVILRSLGLIRYRNGSYQVALPRDDGVVDVAARANHVDAVDSTEGMFRRRRYFEWLNLSPDPISAVERLRVIKERQPDLDLFITPLVNRVRRGHSPRAILGCISRCRALADGRDPMPWRWLSDPILESDERSDTARADGQGTRRVRFEPDWIEPRDLDDLLEGHAPEPIDGWREWYDEQPDEAFLQIPAVFMPARGDLCAPLSPFNLLKVDWQTNGWATQQLANQDEVTFEPVEVSPFRLGLFDHDADSRIHDSHNGDFRERLERLSVHVHRGLVRMWVDLQRERVETAAEGLEPTRMRKTVDDSLDQSLELLGELLVRPLIARDAGVEVPELDGFDAGEGAAKRHFQELEARASTFLREQVVEETPPENAARTALDARLTELGFSPPPAPDLRKTLFRQVSLSPVDIAVEADESSINDPDLQNERSRGLLELRGVLNELTEQLYDFGFLKQYRDQPVRRAPRLSIYVVGDASEPFVRSSLRNILREIHAELLRAYGPIFETYREGFDRALSVTPLIWTPHPADTFGGGHPLANRCEEAAIIESIQGIRRWVESIPLGKRCVPQVLINSRVTDNAVLSLWDSVRQTRDFLNFQMRNDLSGDAWLRRAATGTQGDDFFASFSCHEIAFPAEKAREYLAGRFARHCIRRIRQGEKGRQPQVSDEPIAPPEIDRLIAQPVEKLAHKTEQTARDLAGRVNFPVEAETTRDRIEGKFDDRFERELLGAITDRWKDFTRRRGDMDELVAELRRQTSEQLEQTLDEVRETGERFIEEHASKGGLRHALAGFRALEASADDHLRRREQARLAKQDQCMRHRVPQTNPIGSAREAVLKAADQKPEHGPMKMGLVLWALMLPAMGAPIAWAAAKALELHLEPGVFEFILGPLGPIVGACLLFLPVWWLLRRHMQHHVDRVEEAIGRMADAVRRVVDGGKAALASNSPSIRSFMEARLVHTAALATRNYARQVYERVFRDLTLAGRLRRSVDLQEDLLMRRAEDMGVRVKMSGLDAAGGQDDLGHLFASRSKMPTDTLIGPDNLSGYYEREFGDDRIVDNMLETFIGEVGGFDNWRKIASLSDTGRILQFARLQFDELIDEPVSNQFIFEDEVRRRLIEFVRSNYSNVGFGAKFSGYEGLDPDGVDILARTALVLHPELEEVFEKARTSDEESARLDSLETRTAQIRPNVVYMLSLAQGIRPHSLRNLRRFESFHHRAQMPDDRTFPLSGDDEQTNSPINHLTGYDTLGEQIFERVTRLVESTRPADPQAPAHRGGSGE